jgi:hypothetical protein
MSEPTRKQPPVPRKPPHPAAGQPGSFEPGSALTARAVLVSLLTAALVGFAFPYSNLVIRGTRPANTSLPFGTVAVFFMLVALANPLLRLIRRSLALSRADMLVVFVAALLASSVVTWGLVGQLLPIMTGATYYAQPENHWQELFQPTTVPWLGVQDEEVARQFYEGTVVGGHVPWHPWLLPLAMWMLFSAALFAASIGLMILLRRQWVERERLVYPLMRLPVEMVAGADQPGLLPPLLRSRLFWIGALIAIIPSLFIGLHFYCPIVPRPNLRQTVTIPLQMERVPLRLWTNFSVVAFAYLINADLGFSLSFFAVFSTVQTPVLRLMGVQAGAMEIYCAGSPAVSNQAMGAMILLVAASLHTARREISGAFRAALGLPDAGAWEAERPLASAAVLCLVGGALGMVWWLVTSGLPLLATLAFLFAAFVTFTALTRAAVQGGVPVSRAALIPQSFVLHALGSAGIGRPGIASLAYSFSWSADIRVFLMPFAAHALKAWSEARVNRRSFLPLAAAVLALSTAVAVVTTLLLAYSRGGVSLSGWLFRGCPQAAFRFGAGAMESPMVPSLSWWLWMALGAAVMWALTVLHLRFIGWPLHPLGFAIAPTQPVQDLWFSIFVGWLLKVWVLRYGGYRTYERGIELMLGLILGQFLACAGWVIVDALTGSTGNLVFVY